ncbi:MAG: response regulator [Silicimonas sp.]|nr:response regulator [Silicimonas sp.]
MLKPAQDIDTPLVGDQKRPMQVLVLDDSEVDRKRMLRLCEDAGLNIDGTEAATLDELRAVLPEKQFDIIFIDYLLAGEDGLDAVDIVAADPHQSAVSIMIAGEGRLDIAVEAMRRGCLDYLTKSGLTIEALQKSVATAMERHFTGMALAAEREHREKLERAVRRYANACSVEMRTILAGTLRRVRKLRAHNIPEDHASQLSELETSITQLWDTLPQFEESAPGLAPEAAAPLQLRQQ